MKLLENGYFCAMESQPVIDEPPPVQEYAPGTWGPVNERLTPPGGWQNPVVKR